MLENLPLPGAELLWDPAWLAPEHADALLVALRREIDWETHRIRMFGRWLDSPRRSCWIGDPGAGYVYSGARFEPRPWPARLTALRGPLREATGVAFNSVLANLYRDGSDSMGWHADDESELGPQPVIASLSLGQARRFKLKHRQDPARKLDLDLPHGSLLVMRGETQKFFKHALPRSARPMGPRVNLTFRLIGS